MKNTIVLLALLLVIVAMTPACGQTAQTIDLPEPDRTGRMAVEQALVQRRSMRNYTSDTLRLDEVSQLLWAAQGITHPEGYRTAPSAGALYPLEVYLTGGRVENLPPGVYRYRPKDHELVVTDSVDRRTDLADAALDQAWVEEGAIALVIAGVYGRTRSKYGERGVRYVHMEVGAAAQNVYLQATALDLGTVFVGAFEDRAVKKMLDLPEDHRPLGVMPVGHPTP